MLVIIICEPRPNSDYDRAYKWDHGGRLEAASTGLEARIFAGKPPGSSGDGPYSQTYQHDEWGNMTNRTSRFWSKTDSHNISYNPTTGRNQDPNWSYDAAGNLTQDSNLKYLYDAAGFNWQLQTLSGSPNLTQLRDADGKVIQRGCIHYLNSTPLGGLPVAELNCLGGKHRGNVYLAGSLIANLINATWSVPPDKWVVWNHVNPVTGGNGRSGENRWYEREAELDPMGVNVGFEDPFAPPILPPDPDMEQGIPALHPGAGETGKRCNLDGIIVDCGFVAPLIESGTVVAAPTQTTVSLYNNQGKFAGWGFFNPNSGGYDYHQVLRRQIVLGGQVIDETWDIIKQREVVPVNIVAGDIIGTGWGGPQRGGQRLTPRESAPVKDEKSCSELLASMFGGPGSVVEIRGRTGAGGYYPAANAERATLTPTEVRESREGGVNPYYDREHLYWWPHLYGNAEKTSSTDIFLPPGHKRIWGPVGSNNIVSAYYEQLGGYKNVTLAVAHVADYGVRGEKGRTRIGRIGGPGGNSPQYIHAHFMLWNGRGYIPPGDQRDSRTLSLAAALCSR